MVFSGFLTLWKRAEGLVGDRAPTVQSSSPLFSGRRTRGTNTGNFYTKYLRFPRCVFISFFCRTELFEYLSSFFPAGMTHPREDLVDFVKCPMDVS